MGLGSKVATPGVLTERQRACLTRVAEGRTSKEIARELAISPSTVDNHINTAVRLIGCNTRLEAARLIQLAALDSLNPVQPDDGQARTDKPKSLEGAEDAPAVATWRWVPPMGGRTNAESTYRRLIMLAQVIILGLMVGIAAILAILGAVRLAMT